MSMQRVMHCIKTYTLDEIFPLIPDTDNKVIYRNIEDYYVKLSSQRLITFKKNHVCVCCGLQGNEFRLEFSGKPERYNSDPKPDRSKFGDPHFNLYNAETNRLITKDHIVAKINDGKDILSNYQTMCIRCNVIKDSFPCTLDVLKQAITIFNTANISERNPHKAARKFLLSIYR